MADHCLTYVPRGREPGGMTIHGLYRRLRRKTGGTGLRVETHTGSVERLLEEGSGPWIITVGLSSRTAADRIYSEQYGSLDSNRPAEHCGIMPKHWTAHHIILFLGKGRPCK